jgi:hypothetical protein
MRVAAVALAAAVVALPPPSFRVGGAPLSLSGAGPRVAVVTAECAVRVADLTSRLRPAAVRAPAPCRDPEASVATDDVWLGRNAIVVQTIDSPSPHGDQYALWAGPLPRGPLPRVGDDWGWTDSDVPGGYGCAWTVASGGGVIAMAEGPNTLAVDHGVDENPVCPAGATTRIRLLGAGRTSTAVAGSWGVLATDGRRLALARLGTDGARTGELGVFALSGKRLAAPRIAPATVKAAFRAWLTPEGLVVSTRQGVVTRRWSTRQSGDVTVGYGRVLYVDRRTLYVRRIRGGAARRITTVPSAALLAAGSFGVAVATGADTTVVYRLPWRTIDRVLPR